MSFIAENFFWIVGIIGGLGTAAVAVAIFALGVPALLIVDKVVGFFRECVKAFQTPLGQALGILFLMGAAAFGGAIVQARSDAADRVALNAAWEKKMDESAALFAKARQARDELVDKNLDTFVQQKNAEIGELQQKVNSYEGKDHPACVLTPADLERVRQQRHATPATKSKPASKRWWDAIRNRG